MFDINVSNEQLAFASNMVENYNFGNRGYADGNKSEQETGIIGQTVFADLIGQERPSGENGFDGGFDFVINGKRVDIKTMGRTVPMKDNYVHNFVGCQKKYDAEYYVFASYNKKTEVLTICGYIDKESFFEKADFFAEGTKRTRTDGTSFKTKADLYEIVQNKLNSAGSIEDILNGIK